MKTIFKFFLTFFLLLSFGFVFWFFILNNFSLAELNSKIEEFKNFYFLNFFKEQEKDFSSLEEELENFQKEIFQPPPLKYETSEKIPEETQLTSNGIIYWTNFYRQEAGLKSLKENQLLNLSARMKLEDMFKRQYFEHLSPTGENVDYWTKLAGYDFILIGENLALGNFRNDEEIVNAWMASEGHRENILNPSYQEIGVAVAKGVFEGQEVWIGVQHFGLNVSVCVLPNSDLKNIIENNEKELEEIEIQLENLKKEIKQKDRFLKEEYFQKIEEYNNLVFFYNNLLAETQRLIENYNQQVKSFNECLLSYTQ